MGKAGFSSKDAVAVSLGIQEGNVEIIAAISKIHQYPPNKDTGDQGEPFGCVQLELQQYDSKWVKDDAEPTKMEFGWGGGFGKADKFHPGLAQNAQDDDPQDLGDEVDIEGNCICTIVDGAQLNTKCKWIMLSLSLEKLGFKPEVLGNGFLPDLIGTRGHVKTITLERIPGSTAKREPTALVFDRIDVFPYEAKKKPAASAKGGAATPAKTGTSKTPPPPAPAGDDDETIAVRTLAEVKTEQGGETLEIKAFRSKSTSKLMRAKVPTARHKAILALMTDPAWLQEQSEAEDAGMVFDADASTIEFASE